MKKRFIIDWFVEKSTMSQAEIEKDMDINYFEKGLIDSFAFLELLTLCEDKLGIKFNDDDFQDDSIFTISGFISLIERK